MEIMAFGEKLDRAVQLLDEAVTHLLTPTPDHVLPQLDTAWDPLPHLVYNSESKSDSDSKLDPDLPWREVRDIPSFQLQASN